MKVTKTLIASLMLSASLLTSTGVVKAENYVVMMPRIVSDQDKRLVKETLGKILKISKGGDTIIALDSIGNRVIGIAELPDKSIMKHEKVRIRYARNGFSKVAQFLKNPRYELKEAQPTEVFSNFADHVRSLKPDETYRVLYIGDFIEHDDKWPGMSMRGGRYPNDGHFKVDSYLSPYGTADRSNALNNTTFHMCYRDEQYLNRSHEKAVERFWSLSVKSQGGVVGSFTKDTGICLTRFLKNSAPAKEFTINPNEDKPVMIKLLRAQARNKETPASNSKETLTEELKGLKEMPQAVVTKDQAGRFLGTDIPVQTQSPTKTTGLVKVGIRWEKEIDLDIYVSSSPTAKPLFFNNKSSDLGSFSKDWRGSPNSAHAYEFVEFHKPIDVRGMRIAVNFYKGVALNGARGVLRIWIEGQGIWEKSFVIASSKGNSGSRKDRNGWVYISPLDVLGLPRTAG